MVNFKLEGAGALTPQEMAMLEAAKSLPQVYDEDSPALTDDMERALRRARQARPYQREPLTLYVAPETMIKAKALGTDYINILGRLLDKAVDDYKSASV